MAEVEGVHFVLCSKLCVSFILGETGFTTPSCRFSGYIL